MINKQHAIVILKFTDYYKLWRTFFSIIKCLLTNKYQFLYIWIQKYLINCTHFINLQEKLSDLLTSIITKLLDVRKHVNKATSSTCGISQLFATLWNRACKVEAAHNFCNHRIWVWLGIKSKLMYWHMHLYEVHHLWWYQNAS